VATFLRQHFEVWLIGAFGLMLLDYFLTISCRRLLREIAPELALKMIGQSSSRPSKYFLETRFIFMREYARLGSANLRRVGNALLAIRITYFAWFSIGIWIVFRESI